MAQPRWGTGEQQVERQGVDIVFVLDTSLSMATRDVVPNRLWVAQTLVRQMAKDLPGHRVALVQAEGDGVVMVPLTADVAVLELREGTFEFVDNYENLRTGSHRLYPYETVLAGRRAGRCRGWPARRLPR